MRPAKSISPDTKFQTLLVSVLYAARCAGRYSPMDDAARELELHKAWKDSEVLLEMARLADFKFSDDDDDYPGLEVKRTHNR